MDPNKQREIARKGGRAAAACERDRARRATPDKGRPGWRMLATLLVGAALTGFVLATPEWNFDVVCYAGAARIWLGEPPAQAHANVYRELRTTAPPEAVYAIRSLSEYRETVAESVDVFLIQLPMYAVKALYVAIIAAVVKLGGNSISAPFQISAVAYGGFAVLVLLALARVASIRVMFAVGLPLLLSPPFLEVGRLSTPDALSAYIVFGGLYALVFAGKPLTGAGLLLLSIVARPNNIILCVAIASWWWWKDPSRSPWPFLAATLGMLVSLIVTWMTGGYSWGVYFTHAYLRRITDLATVRSEVTVSNYLATLWPALRGANVLYPSFALLFLVITIMGSVTARGTVPAKRRREVGLQVAVWGSLAVQFVIYPMVADRLFVVHYALVSIVTVSLIGSSRGDEEGMTARAHRSGSHVALLADRPEPSAPAAGT